MKVLKVYLPDAVILALEGCAKDQGRTKSNLIRHALKGYLSRYGYKNLQDRPENVLHVHAKASEGSFEEGLGGKNGR